MLSAPTSRGKERQRRFRILTLEAGITASSIAVSLGVDRSAVSSVVAGRSRSEKIEAEIARLFPELVHVFPFGDCRRHGSTVARRTQQVNCSTEQEVRSPTKRRSSPVRRGKKKSA
jgi:hypothetical protein